MSSKVSSKSDTRRRVKDSSAYRSDMIWYFIGVLVRIIWTMIYPQRGYIHPDEFFQGPEIVFDDIFRTNLTRTHEFNPTTPLRSVAILYLLYGIPVSILSSLSYIFNWSVISFYLKLMCPRLTMLVLSLCTDILFYRLLKLFYRNLNSKQYGTIMNYYGIAHVTLVFFTRTLSNSFEAFLFLGLIYFIETNISSLLSAVMNSSVKTRSDMNTIKNTVKPRSRSISMNVHLISTSSLIGVICALGIFNRPTFPAFAVVPIVYWFINIMWITGRRVYLYTLLSKIISYIVGTFTLTSVLIIVFDSYYYNNGFSFIIDIKHGLIVCPLNFIFYNMDRKNLDQHGLHPTWLHFLVNATILYGPLHLTVILWSLWKMTHVKQCTQTIISQVICLFQKTSTKFQQSERSVSTYVLLLYLVPYIPLSTFPHQEPRFLLPLIFPLIIFIVPVLIERNFQTPLFRVWLSFNTLLAIIYGHLHQGGLLPALQHVHDYTVVLPNQLSYSMYTDEKFLVTYHTYMPPGYLVTLMSTSEHEHKLNTIIIDLKGAKLEELDSTIKRIFNQHSSKNIQVFVILPDTYQAHLAQLKQQNYSCNIVERFGSHLDLDHGFDDIFHMNDQHKQYQWLHAIENKLKLNLYQISKHQTN